MFITYVPIGYTPDEIRIHPIELILSEAHIVPSVAASKRDLETAVRAADGRVEMVIDTGYPLEDVSVGLDRLRSRSGQTLNELAEYLSSSRQAAAKHLPEPPDVLELDVNEPTDLERVAADLAGARCHLLLGETTDHRPQVGELRRQLR